jgi:cation diffusion facilitator family transporter
MVAVIISLMLFLTAYEIANEAITHKTYDVEYPGWVLGIVGLLILVPFFFGRYEVNVGKKVRSPSLVADGSQFKADVLSSIVVFVSLIGQRFDIQLDRAAAVLIALFILRAGWGLLSGSMRVLLDASVDPGTLEQIHSVIRREPAVSTVESVTGRNSGRYLFVEARVALRITDLKRANLISERIENDIKRTLSNVDRVLIHYEPRSRDQIRYAVALANTKGEISKHFGESPYFAIVDIDLIRGGICKQEIIVNPHFNLTKGRGIQVAQFLLDYKLDVVITDESLQAKGPGYVFADAGVETRQTTNDTLDRLMQQVMESLT